MQKPLKHYIMPVSHMLSAFLVLMVFLPSKAFCEIKCVDSEGEALIVNSDVPSAKTEAVARAKWGAVELTVGVEVKAQSVVQNMALVDDAVSKQVKGFVSNSKVLKEENRGDTLWVRINACVEPTKAKDAVASLALNNSVAVFIPARKPKVVSESEEVHRSRYGRSERHELTTKDEYDETNILSESLIGQLTEHGYTVVDVAPTHAVDAEAIENAIKSGNFMVLRSLMYKFLTNVLLIGKIDYTVSTKKGQDVGFGISMPFNNVTARLTYRIVTRDASGKMVVLTAGVDEGKGLAGSVEDATAEAHKVLTEKFAPVVFEKLAQFMKGVTKKVRVRVDGVSDMNTNFEVKDVLQHLAWVTDVGEKALGDYMVSYPENTVYLANSISQKGNFRITNFSPLSISVSYQK